MQFKPHGDIKIRWMDNCCLITPSGPINEEGAIVFNQKVELEVCNKKLESWYRIECLCAEGTLGTPGVYELLADSLKWSLDNGCKLTILVKSSVLNQEKFKQASEKVSMPFYHFSNLEQALEFCKAQS